MKTKQQIFLIHGIYFYEGAMPGIGHEPGIGEIVVTRHTGAYSLFSGVIAPHKDDGTTYGGELSDYFGESTLSEVEISDNTLSFLKTYKVSGYTSLYTFKRAGPLWFGSWGSRSGSDNGCARCIVHSVTESFFHVEDPKVLDVPTEVAEKVQPPCDQCGSIMIRKGSECKCPNCEETKSDS